MGDWVGLLAVTALAVRLGNSTNGVAVGVVLSARLLPGFFFGSFASGLLDRLDRKKLMVVCDIGRGLVMAALPFVRDVPGLFFASLLLELLTLMWTPAKEASVPNLVPAETLPAANSLSLVAAYGTIVPGALLFAGLTSVAGALGVHVHQLRFLRLRKESLAIYFDVITFFASAALIYTLDLPTGPASEERDQQPPGHFRALRLMLSDAKEGWQFIAANPLVRSVIVGISTGLIGGGMLIPLGAGYSRDVLHAGNAGFGLLEFSLGVGVGLGVVALSVLQRRLTHQRAFTMAVLGAGVFIIVGASLPVLPLTMLAISLVGVCAGAVYVLGFTMLQTNVDDALRGRIFGVFYTLVRFCLLMALVLAPLLSSLLDSFTGPTHRIHGGSWSLYIPGVRLTLWLGGGIIIAAGAFVWRTLRSHALLEKGGAASGSGHGPVASNQPSGLDGRGSGTGGAVKAAGVKGGAVNRGAVEGGAVEGAGGDGPSAPDTELSQALEDGGHKNSSGTGA
jgi:dTMP kinase